MGGIGVGNIHGFLGVGETLIVIDGDGVFVETASLVLFSDLKVTNVWMELPKYMLTTILN
jgi:hypothetical protein